MASSLLDYLGLSPRRGRSESARAGDDADFGGAVRSGVAALRSALAENPTPVVIGMGLAAMYGLR